MFQKNTILSDKLKISRFFIRSAAILNNYFICKLTITKKCVVIIFSSHHLNESNIFCSLDHYIKVLNSAFFQATYKVGVARLPSWILSKASGAN